MVSAAGLRCKRCGVSDYARSGGVRRHQRYRCRACGCHFTDTPGGASRLRKALAVLKWVRAEASALPDPAVLAEVVTVKVDEMWHYLKKVCQALGLACL